VRQRQGYLGDDKPALDFGIGSSSSPASMCTASCSRQRATTRRSFSRDPDLASPRGDALRHLLYLFERDEAIRLLRAG
jgi:hypothetical protein